MDFIARRTQYDVAQGNVCVIEWLVATQDGIAHFNIRIPKSAVANPTITTQHQRMPNGWLKREGLQAVRRHIFFKKMAERAQKALVLMMDPEHPTIEELEKQWQLGAIFQHDERANNTWCMLMGRPVGESYESIIQKAQEKVKEQRDEILHKRAVEMAVVDDRWGIF